MNGNIIRKTSGGISTIPLEAQLLSKRIILLKGEITVDLAEDVVARLLSLALDDKRSVIDILINSPGGDYAAGMIIYDAIQSIDTPVRLINIGSAYSMAAVLLASGKHGRYLLPHAEVMIHDPYMQSCSGGSSAAIKQTADRLSRKRKEMHRILSVHTGKGIKQIQRATCHDNYMDAHGAIAFGICDGIITINEILEGRYE